VKLLTVRLVAPTDAAALTVTFCVLPDALDARVMVAPLEMALANGLMCNVVMPDWPLVSAVVSVALIIDCFTRLFQMIPFEMPLVEIAAVRPRLPAEMLERKVGVA